MKRLVPDMENSNTALAVNRRKNSHEASEALCRGSELSRKTETISVMKKCSFCLYLKPNPQNKNSTKNVGVQILNADQLSAKKRKNLLLCCFYFCLWQQSRKRRSRRACFFCFPPTNRSIGLYKSCVISHFYICPFFFFESN